MNKKISTSNGVIKRQNIINPLANIVTATPVVKIIEDESLNAFGILFHTRKAIEQFQINSGMKGKYTKEYQHHYWSANARLYIDKQILDISIPLVMYNYDQTISTGDIAFSLIDVNKASILHQDLAMAKYKELQDTPIYKYISEEIGITDWSIIPMNTAHVHPGGENQAFSGIDLTKNAKNPGVVYPLNIGHEVPSFSCIMAHVNNKCKIVHSEYRFFVGTETEKTYIKGRCATIVKGYIPKKLPRVKQQKPVIAKMIDNIFGLIPEQPKVVIQKEAIPKPSYVLRDELKPNDGKEFLNGLSNAWEKTKYEPDTDSIKKENLKEKVYNTRSFASMYNQDDYGMYNYNQKKQPGGEKNATQKDDELSLLDKREFIIENEYATWPELHSYSDKEIAEFYEEVVEIELELQQEHKDEYVETEIDKLRRTEDKKPTLTSYSIICNGNKYNQDQVSKIRFLLEEEEYLSFAKINQMTDYSIIGYYESFYKEVIKGA